jgi:hypothetical protein
MKELQDKFDKLTVRFNIPIKRRNISEPNNREWLKRNMFIQNKDFPEFGEGSWYTGGALGSNPREARSIRADLAISLINIRS